MSRLVQNRPAPERRLWVLVNLSALHPDVPIHNVFSHFYVSGPSIEPAPKWPN